MKKAGNEIINSIAVNPFQLFRQKCMPRPDIYPHPVWTCGLISSNPESVILIQSQAEPNLQD
jgi:hypothetical protein